jgi:hypothetical protein
LVPAEYLIVPGRCMLYPNGHGRQAMDVKRTEIVTSCRRRMITGRFRIPSTPAMERVVLRIDQAGDGSETVWASLTAEEAFALAQALMTEAGAIRSR